MKEVERMRTESRREIYLAGGCFGVEGTSSASRGGGDRRGYANGDSRSDLPGIAAYGHAETVRLVYDSGQVSVQEILEHYFRIIDPSLNRQGNDWGCSTERGSTTRTL